MKQSTRILLIICIIFLIVGIFFKDYIPQQMRRGLGLVGMGIGFILILIAATAKKK